MSLIKLCDYESSHFYYIQCLLNKENLDKFILPKKEKNTVLKLNFKEESFKKTKYWKIYKTNEAFRNEFYKKYFNNPYYDIIDELKNKELYIYYDSFNYIIENDNTIVAYKVLDVLLHDNTLLLSVDNKNKLIIENIPEDKLKTELVYITYTDDKYLHGGKGYLFTKK